MFRMQPVGITNEGSFRPNNNTVRVPESPGLGVTLARDMLTRLHQHYVENEPMNKYHDPAVPGTCRCLPLH